jgi:nicotinamidase-related amidase
VAESGAGASALLVMDVQKSIVSSLPETQTYLVRLRRVVDTARRASIPVMYVVVRFRDGYPDVNPRNARFSQIRGSGRLLASDPNSEIDPAVAPTEDEPVVVKKRVSAFVGSDLDVLLRSQGIEELILTGIATSGVVLSTLRAAADMDYRLTVIADCCADADEEVHRVLTTKVFPRQAEVVSAEEWIRRHS